ncbi:MAG: RdgB/HAM1 family non-canonical purine NTP pyrophosphatase [Planctomycetota bacterium]
MELLIATNNPDKYAEMRELMSDLPVDLFSLEDFPHTPEVEEDRPTFAGNAAKKASEMARLTRMHAVADDSGLCVDALDGAPGVYSARYAGESGTYRDVCQKLLRQMRDVNDNERGAHFECHIALSDPDGNIRLRTQGRCEGAITRQRRGGRGFGYDPVFLYLEAGKTFAQMMPEEKHKFSHRGEALREFKPKFEEYLETPENFSPKPIDPPDEDEPLIDIEEFKEKR